MEVLFAICTCQVVVTHGKNVSSVDEVKHESKFKFKQLISIYMSW